MALTFSVLETVSPETWVDRTDRLRKRTLRLTEDLDRHATLNCTVFASDGWSVDIGRQVKLEDDVDGVQFAGKCFARTFRASGDLSNIEYDLVCASYERVTTQRVTGLRYYDEQTSKVIIQDLNDNCLTGEGFTADANVADGATIDHLEFNYITVAEALDKICELNPGYYWYVDDAKDIHFFERTATAAPFSITDADVLVDVTIKDSDESYYNRVNVLEDETGDTVTVSQSNEQVDARSALEGGTGYHEAVITIAQNAEDPDAIATAFLSAHAAIGRISEMTVRQIGLHAGQSLTVVITQLSISDTYLIKSVALSDESGESRWHLVLSDGSDIPDWLDAIRGGGGVYAGGAVPTVTLPESVTLGTITYDRDLAEFDIALTMPTAGVKPTRLHVFAECPDQSDVAVADGSQAWDGTHAAAGFPDPIDCGYHDVSATTDRIKATLPVTLTEDMTARVKVLSATATAEQAYADAPSATVTVGPPVERKTGSGVEWAPCVTGLTGTLHVEQIGADWFWWFDLTWAEPTSDLDWPQVEGYDIIVWDPTAGDTLTAQCSLVSSEPSGKTAYTLPDLWRVPDDPTTYRIYVRTRGIGGVNTIVPAVTPYVEFAPEPAPDTTGQEYANLIRDLAFSATPYWEKDPATGQPRYVIPLSFTHPTEDPRYGWAYLVVTRSSGADPKEQNVIRTQGTATFYITAADGFPEADDTLTITAYSVDLNGNANTYAGGTTPQITEVMEPQHTAVPVSNVTGFGVTAAYTEPDVNGKRTLKLTPTFTPPADDPSWAYIEFWAYRPDASPLQWYHLGDPAHGGAIDAATVEQLPTNSGDWIFKAISKDVNGKDRNGNANPDPADPPSGTPSVTVTIAPPTAVSHVTGFSVSSAYTNPDHSGKRTLQLTPTFTVPADRSWAYIDFWAYRPDSGTWHNLGYPSQGGAVDVATVEQLPATTGTWNFVAISHDVFGKDRDGNANSDPASPPSGSPTASLSIAPPATGTAGTEYTDNVTGFAGGGDAGASTEYRLNVEGAEEWRAVLTWTRPATTSYGGNRIWVRYDPSGTPVDIPLEYTGPDEVLPWRSPWYPVGAAITADLFAPGVAVAGQRENTIVVGVTPRIAGLTIGPQTTGSLKGGRVDTGSSGGPIIVKDSLGATFCEIGKIARGTSPETYYYGIRITGADFTLVFDPTAGLTIENTSAADEDVVALTDGYVAVTQRDNANIRSVLMSNDLLITSRRDDGGGGYLGATFHVSVTDDTYTLELLDADNNPILQATSAGVAVNALSIGGTATGDAATKDVGTTAGTVAAGDDSRFVTNGDSHDHNGGDGAQIAFANLSGVPTLPRIDGAVNATGQTGSIGSSSILTPASNGMYRASVFLICTTAGSAGTVTASIGFVDENGNTSSTSTSALPLTVETWNEKTICFYATTGGAITYLTTVSGASGDPQYAVRIRVERVED